MPRARTRKQFPRRQTLHLYKFPRNIFRREELGNDKEDVHKCSLQNQPSRSPFVFEVIEKSIDRQIYHAL